MTEQLSPRVKVSHATAGCHDVGFGNVDAWVTVDAAPYRNVKIGAVRIISGNATTLTLRDPWGEYEIQRAPVIEVTNVLGQPLDLPENF